MILPAIERAEAEADISDDESNQPRDYESCEPLSKKQKQKKKDQKQTKTDTDSAHDISHSN